MALDRLAVIFKSNLAATSDGLGNGDIVGIVDEIETGKSLEDTIDPKLYLVSLVVEFDRADKDFIIDSMKPIGIMTDGSKDPLYYRPRKRILDIKALQGLIENPYLESDAIAPDIFVPLIDATKINVDLILVDSLYFEPRPVIQRPRVVIETTISLNSQAQAANAIKAIKPMIKQAISQREALFKKLDDKRRADWIGKSKDPVMVELIEINSDLKAFFG